MLGITSILFIIFNGVCVRGDGGTYDVTPFHVRDLLSGNRLPELSRVLSDTGMIAIVDTPISNLQTTRKQAFTGMCSCLSSSHRHSVNGVDSALLSDGTTRTTLATATIGESPLQLKYNNNDNDDDDDDDDACDDEDYIPAMDALRDHVAVAAHAFVHALDQVLHNDNNTTTHLLETVRGVQYHSVQSIVKDSHHLEHFHVYEKKRTAATENNWMESHDDDNNAVLQTHTDAGLFLAFVPGMSCDHHDDQDQHLYVEEKLAVFPPGSVGIMLGVGSEHWLTTTTTTKLRATRHAVAMRSGEKRAWYGMMHLVPQDAIIQDIPRRTFGDMQKAMAHSNTRTFGDAQADDDDAISIGCGSASSAERISGSTRIQRRRLGMVDDASYCNNVTSFFCWSSCLDIPDAEEAADRVEKGQSLYCLDPGTLVSSDNSVQEAVADCTVQGVVGGGHNHACIGVWQDTADNVPSQQVRVTQEEIAAVNGFQEQFCYGGTSMYMDGFHWTDPTCVIYLFPSWVLTSRGALWGASLGTIAFGVATEAVVKYRRILVQSATPGWQRLGVSSVMYGLQLTMGYLIMLVVMTYSGPLFMCVILGFMGGHVYFNFDQVRPAKKVAETEQCCNTSLGENVTGQSCCEKIEEDEDDREKQADICVPEGCTPCCQNTL